MIQITRTTSENLHFLQLIPELDKELHSIYRELQTEYDKHNIIEKLNTVIVAYLDETPVGCGCFKPFDANSVEIKRMFVQADLRGLGISKAILTELENWAREDGFKHAVLETGTEQFAAIALYEKSGYTKTKNYGPYVNMSTSVCYKKILLPETGGNL